jgi:hypothetical protein
MSVGVIIGVPLILVGIVIMIGCMRERHTSAALMTVLGALFVTQGAWMVANELSSEPFRIAGLVVRAILVVGCLVLCVRAIRRATHQEANPS